MYVQDGACFLKSLVLNGYSYKNSFPSKSKDDKRNQILKFYYTEVEKRKKKGKKGKKANKMKKRQKINKQYL